MSHCDALTCTDSDGGGGDLDDAWVERHDGSGLVSWFNVKTGARADADPRCDPVDAAVAEPGQRPAQVGALPVEAGIEDGGLGQDLAGNVEDAPVEAVHHDPVEPDRPDRQEQSEAEGGETERDPQAPHGEREQTGGPGEPTALLLLRRLLARAGHALHPPACPPPSRVRLVPVNPGRRFA